MKKDILIILPFKESLIENKAGAVSIYVTDTTKSSKFKNKIKIISSDLYNKKKLFRNRNYIKNICDNYSDKKIKLIEIHNRPEYVKIVKKKFPNVKINLFFHNDPLLLRGSDSVYQREELIKNCFKIVFISKWIQQRFFTSFKNVNFSNVDIIHHGINKIKNINLKKKEKKILFVGKLNEAKGYHIFCDVAKKFLKIDPTWKFIAIGNETRKKIFPDKEIVNEVGYKKNREVLNFYKKSEISVGNSVWNEPLGRIAIESSSRMCLPIISNKAGLEESKDISIVLKENTSKELLKVLLKITSNEKYRRLKQNEVYRNNKFTIDKISKKLDNLRDKVFYNNINTKIKKTKKILHIANFNENADGRLFYSFSNKLNNGLIKNNYIVQTLSDRFFLKKNRYNFFSLNTVKMFNNKIINMLKNFSPDVLIIGHVFNIDESVYNYCKNNNIKILSWFIDSVSPEFLKGDAKNKFLNNLKFVDYCFITSSPGYFKKNKYYNKIKYIPNPVDTAIDCYKNFKDKKLEYDLFVAISHGQNRGILKEGKIDERHNLINYIVSNLPQIKFAKFGTDKLEPIWGANFFHYLSKSKMAVNISRGEYQNLYSSDRISSLIGNGLLVFIDKKTKFNKVFNNNEVVFYKNKLDLIKKINFYKKNEILRNKIAKKGYEKYHKEMNNVLISKYMLSCIDYEKIKKPSWAI